jgi:uncharacterized lipoprotein YddW (UPF0748 family)
MTADSKLENRLKIRGVWSNPGEAGKTAPEVSAFAQKLQDAHINLVAMCFKTGGGIHWPSRLFPQAVAEGYTEFDFPAVLVSECAKRGIRVHAWFIDFMESATGAAYHEHPEWAMRNPEGGTTASEALRGRTYHSVWMCPAQRPGYADQWLIPLMAEFAERYDVEAVHHDYIRYPGDLAPDRYCFCDYCLREIPRFAGHVTDAFPDRPFYHDQYDRPYIESHWEQSPRVLPPNWDVLPRAMKSRFLLEGSSFPGGRYDLDYFFYRYRTHAITRFAREAAEAVRAAKPGMLISAALFKNAVQSGRFIGQDWQTFGPWVDIAMPMDYRDHYPGDFDTYMILLAESIEQQKEWARDYRSLWPGFAINQLFCDAEPSPERFHRTVDCIRNTGVEGICLFSSGLLTRYDLWTDVREGFARDVEKD